MGAARYDAIADFYEDGWPDSYEDTVSVALFTVLGSVTGLAVLDAACGHGRITRELARRGARHVVGLDVSSQLIAKAEAAETAVPLGVHYVHDDLATSTLLEDESFDVVVCSFGLSDVDDLEHALANVGRCLDSGGRFVFSILHPCFPGGDEVSGAWPSTGRYYDELRWQADGAGSTLRTQVGANHRMLSTYVNALHRHGLRLEQIIEPEPPSEWSRERPTAARFPVFLVVGCSKG
jgi:SAM-dependent methyltransferase